MVINNLSGKVFLNYVIASVLVLSALSLKLSLSAIRNDESPFLLFFAAIFLATWRGGFWCGVYSTVLSVMLSSYYFVAPIYSFKSSLNNLLSLSIFCIEAILIAWMTDSLLRAKVQLAQSLQMEMACSTQLGQSVAQIKLLNERLQLAMTETHHRVKNSLQTVSALLAMQIRGEKSISPQEGRELISHVRGIGVLHDLLTEECVQSKLGEIVQAKRVVEKMVPLLKQSAGARTINFQIEDGSIDVRQASSLAVILNELVSNAIKHGGSNIDVLLLRHDRHLVLQVKDDGVGFAYDFDPTVQANTGLRLIHRLSQSDFDSIPSFDRNGTKGGGCVTIQLPTMPSDALELHQ